MKDNKFLYPLYACLHPIAAMEDIKWKKMGSYRVSFFYLLLWVISNIAIRKGTGFAFNMLNIRQVNVSDVMLITICVFIIAVISNWLLCTLMEGEGKFKEIWCAISYPTLILSLWNIGYVIITNIVPLEIAPFISMVGLVINIWFGLLIFVNLMIIHDFSFGKTIWNCIFTFVGMAIVAFLVLLIYSLFMQVASFFVTIYNEITFRL
jgi:hypothetical protein